MGSLQAESEEKLDMDDSGCIQDESPPSKRYDVSQGVQLLDLSDDVLLLILRFLAPRDLKALGYTCPRLGALVLDRSLWQVVDARGQPWGRARLRWYLSRALHAGTKELLLAGYAREARECLGHVNQTREEIEAARQLTGDKDYGKEEDNNNTEPDLDPDSSRSGHSDRSQSPRIIEVPALGPNAQLYIDDDRDESPEAWAWPRASDPLISDSTCPGPQFTLTQRVLRQLAHTCPALTSLGLEYCNINCNTTSITQFPATLKKLSLRGSKCYNLPLDRSFLFKIQDTMPDLETLDVSECEWMEPASLLPLSKLPALLHLYARDCLRLTEFVAYASLATRYGFTKLQSLDLRGSPVGDSEVSALGWLSNLRRLLLAPRAPSPARGGAPHSHHKRDALPHPATPPGDRWEAQEPEYFKIKEPDFEPTTTDKEENKHTWQAHFKGVNGNVSSNSTLSSKPTPISDTNASTSHSTPATSNTQPSPCSSKSQSPDKTNPPGQHSPNQSQSNSSPAPSPGQSKAPKRAPPSPGGAGPSKRKRDESQSDSSSDDDDLPLKCLVNKQSVNEGASTSRAEPPAPQEEAQNVDAQPRHHVLYVNVGQQVHAVYRLSLDNEHIVTFNRNSNARRQTRNIFLSPPGSHVEASSLVTDSAIRRFGRADGEDINYVHIGPNGPYPAAASGARPDRSSLTHLSVTGFRSITDRSLEHLATAAPALQFLDFSETNVTEAGVASFRSLRPDVEVRYSPFVKKD